MPDVLRLQVGYFYERPIYPRRRYYPTVLVFRYGEVATIEIGLNVGETVRDLITGQLCFGGQVPSPLGVAYRLARRVAPRRSWWVGVRRTATVGIEATCSSGTVEGEGCAGALLVQVIKRSSFDGDRVHHLRIARHESSGHSLGKFLVR